MYRADSWVPPWRGCPLDKKTSIFASSPDFASPRKTKSSAPEIALQLHGFPVFLLLLPEKNASVPQTSVLACLMAFEEKRCPHGLANWSPVQTAVFDADPLHNHIKGSKLLLEDWSSGLCGRDKLLSLCGVFIPSNKTKME